MNLRPFIVLSLAANVVLAAVYLPRALARTQTPAAESVAPTSGRTTTVDPQLKTRNSPSDLATATSWSELDSTDLKTLAARLRAAGFPASRIRAVINTRLQAQFAARLSAIGGSPQNTPYWQPLASSSQALNAKYNAERLQISRDRAKLLREILGDDALASDPGDITAAQRRDYGDLPKSKIDLIQRINDDYAEMSSQIRVAMLGITLPEDREKFALLEREKRVDLAAILTPQELEDYLMRSSTATLRLRSALTMMDASEAEFKTIFRLQQPFDSILNPMTGTITADMSRQRTEAQKQLQEQIKAALGETRAADFARASDYEFQRITQITQRENLPLSAAAATYDLRASTALASRQISDDKSLSYDQKLAALKNLAQTTEAQIAAHLGVSAAATYTKSADWLRLIANGASIELSNGGMSIRSLPRPPSSPPANPARPNSPPAAGWTPQN